MSGAASLCRTPPRPVPLPQVGDALRAIWRSCSSGAGEADVARSLAINFVGIAEVADEAELRAAVERLQHRTPCRAFLLLLDDREAQVRAEVAATTRLQGETHDIVLEEIAVRMPAAAFPRLPGVVRPLLVNDLPSHLFWNAPWPQRESFLDDLAALCDHTVVDSRRLHAPHTELPRLAARRARGARITDLGWLRLRPWRRALAEAFERLPHSAGSSTTTVIHHGARAEAAALLLGDWLADRLGAAVTYVAGPEDDGPCPRSVQLRAGRDEVDLQVAGPNLVAHVTTAAHCFLPYRVPVSRGTDGDLLAAAIDLG
ncbi:MAG: glucose-6-phosphate dehydrogenase assembly protein OpcA [Planctomycetes bacterium]|nr:glucose-6-phosphate dehydrogenase assembly protein OpcA [Planctomycetota bacterium]